MKDDGIIIIKPKGKPEEIMDAIMLARMFGKFNEQIKKFEEEFKRLIE